MNWYIYKIVNLINGKSYVGQRKYDTPNKDNYMGSGKALYHAKKKYGIQNFKKEILCDGLTTAFAANIFEEYFIKKENTLSPNGYNLKSSCMQCGVMSEESKKKMSESAKRKPPMTDEHRKKISESGKIAQNKPDIKAQLAKKHKEYWSKEENRYKQKELLKGHTVSEETKKKIAETLKGHTISEETKKKISESLKGHIPWNKR